MGKNPAGFWIRLGANLIDAVVFAVLGFLLALILGDQIGQNASSGIQFLYGLLLPVFWYGYTVGKKAVSIRIVRKDGTNVTFWTMVKRSLLSGIVYGLPFFLGLIIALVMGWSEMVELFTTPVPADPAAMDMEISNTALSALVILFGGGLLSFILIAASAIMIGVREDKRAIHDLIAGTYVTRNSPGAASADSYEESKEIF
ncbi:RDD family protein [Metabacillus mangrovi]|nr:RDD family protein [Metabacillus mangrovi]